MSTEWVDPLGDTWVCPPCRYSEHGRCMTAGDAHLCACDRREHKLVRTSCWKAGAL